MKKILKLLFTFFVMLFFVVNAKAATSFPDSFKAFTIGMRQIDSSEGENKVELMYDGTSTSDTTYLNIFCIDYMYAAPSGQTYIPDLASTGLFSDAKRAAIAEIIRGATTNEADSASRQFALFTYVQDVVQNPNGDSGTSGIPSVAYYLSLAYETERSVNSYLNATLSLSANSTKLTKSGSNFVSETVTISGIDDPFTVYTVSSSNSDVVINHSDNKSKTFTISIPASKVSGNLTIPITVTGTRYYNTVQVYKTTAGSEYQRVVPNIIVSKRVQKTAQLNFSATNLKFKVSKQDITSHAEVKGAKLQILNSSGTVVKSWTSTTAPVTVEGLAAGTYTLTETLAPDGYVLDTTKWKFQLTSSGAITLVTTGDKVKASGSTLTLYNEKIKVKISKQDINSKKEVPGATIQIFDSDETKIDEWVSTNIPHEIEGLKAGDYTMVETNAPDGYVLYKEEIAFNVSYAGKVTLKSSTTMAKLSGTDLTMYNEQTNVKISKQDAVTKNELPGATLQVYDSDNQLIEEWVSTDTPHEMKGLKPGKYRLVETIAPNKYTLSKEEVTFEIKEDGTATAVVMYNSPIVNVPNTSSNYIWITSFIGLVFIAIGVYFVYRNKKINS